MLRQRKRDPAIFGGMGRGDLDCFFLNPEVDCVVICDVDDASSAKGVEICEKKRGKKPDVVKDFRHVLDRKDVDVVLIATPDHWHALPTVLACQAGMVSMAGLVVSRVWLVPLVFMR